MAASLPQIQVPTAVSAGIRVAPVVVAVSGVCALYLGLLLHSRLFLVSIDVFGKSISSPAI